MANNQILASDNFSSGALASGWSAYPSLSASQVVTNLAEANVVGTSAGQVWTGLTWPNDQCSEVTLQTLTATGSSVVLAVRIQSGAASGYLCLIAPSGSVTIYISNAGTLTQLTQVTGLTVAAGDIWAFQAAGASLTVHQNYARVAFFYDATYTSGNVGFTQTAATALANCQVASWRGYSAAQQDGIWKKQGIVIPAIAHDLTIGSLGVGLQCWSIFQDNNAQLLSGTVYKAWLVSDQSNDVQSSMYYAESSDGLNWTRRGTAVLTGVTNGAVIKVGSTYYLYGQASGSSGSGNMLVYTSPDGVNWALQSPAQVLGLGSGGAWDSSFFYNILAVGQIGSTYYGFYNGELSGSQFSTGLATSTDLINWTKVGTSPVISNALVSGNLVQLGTTWYMWALKKQTGQGPAVVAPYEVVRYSSSNLTSWSLSGHSLHRSQMFESVNALTGGCAPGPILNINGKATMYTNSAAGDATAPQVGQIGLAIAPAPIASIVLYPEDAVVQIISDGFTSGIGNLSANWTTPTGLTKLQIVAGNLCEASVVSTVCGMCYTGSSFGNNQYSEVTIGTLVSPQFIQPAVRMASGAKSYYTVGVEGGTSLPQFSKVVAGVTTVLSATLGGMTISSGDVMRLGVVGNVLSLYQNGYLIAQAEDVANSLTSGSPGMVYFTTSLTQAQTSLWAGGNTGSIPSYGTSNNVLLTPNNVQVANSVIYPNALLTPNLLGGTPDWS